MTAVRSMVIWFCRHACSFYLFFLESKEKQLNNTNRIAIVCGFFLFSLFHVNLIREVSWVSQRVFCQSTLPEAWSLTGLCGQPLTGALERSRYNRKGDPFHTKSMLVAYICHPITSSLLSQKWKQEDRELSVRLTAAQKVWGYRI